MATKRSLLLTLLGRQGPDDLDGVADARRVDGHESVVERMPRSRTVWIARCECGWSGYRASRKISDDQLGRHLSQAVAGGAKVVARRSSQGR